MNIQRYEQLIFYANELKTTKEKIELLAEYFIQNIEVDYIRLEAIKLTNNQEFYTLASEIDFSTEVGKRKAIDKIKAIQDITPEFEAILYQKMGELIQVPIYKPMKLGQAAVIDHYETTYKSFLGVASDIVATPCVYHNGLISRGNCDSFAPFIKSVLTDMGIANKQIFGKGETNHTWNIYYDEESKEWKHYDGTYILYARDGRESAGGHDPYEWSCASTSRMFEMQPIRVITALDDENISLAVPITSENQDDFEISLDSRRI